MEKDQRLNIRRASSSREVDRNKSQGEDCSDRFCTVWHDQPAIGVFRSVQPLGLAGKAQDGIRGGIGIFRDFAA